MARQNKVGGVATSIRVENDNTIIRYHSTDVVKFNAEKITLDTGGWDTPSTKTRMNQAARQFNLGYSVYQKDYTWYAVQGYDWNNPIPFEGNTLTLHRNPVIPANA